MTVGNPALWSDIFPENLVPQILDLVCTTWEAFEKPKPDEHEVPITRRFKCVLQQAKNFRRLPIRIEREVAEDDPATAAELGRIDLKLAPAESAREEVHFAFECKRLYALVNGSWEALASKYVDEGMTRFVEGQYSARMNHGGMIGYVLNGNTAQAKRQVERNISEKRQSLRMTDPAQLAASSLVANTPSNSRLPLYRVSPMNRDRPSLRRNRFGRSWGRCLKSSDCVSSTLTRLRPSASASWDGRVCCGEGPNEDTAIARCRVSVT